MKLYINLIILIIFCLIITNAFADPQIEIEESEYDFGEILQGEKVTHIFILKNIGDEILTVKVRAHCGCTAILLSSNEILPNETAEVKAIFDSANFRKNVTKLITIHSNTPNNTMLDLKITGFVIEEIEVNPYRLMIGQLRRDESQHITITIINRGEIPFSILDIEAIPTQCVNYNLMENELAPGDTTSLELEITPPSKGDYIYAIITLKTNHPRHPEIEITVNGFVQKDDKMEEN